MADSEERAIQGGLRDYEFMNERGSKEAKGRTLNSQVSAFQGQVEFH
jgi:hypothetical protein